MIRSFNDKTDSRLHNIAWLKEHIDEFEDSDMILDLRKPEKSDLMKAFDNAPSDVDLDKIEELEINAARIAFERINQKGQN